MVTATDSALKSPTRWLWVCLGLAACVTNLGCAKMRSSLQGTPILGSAAPFGKDIMGPEDDLYAKHVGKGLERSKTLLAQERARSRGAADGPRTPASSNTMMVRSTEHPAPVADPMKAPVPPLEVALQPPLALPAEGPVVVPPAGTDPAAPAAAAPLNVVEAPAGPVNVVTPPTAVADGVAAPASPANVVAAPAAPQGGSDRAAIESVVTEARKKLDSLVSYQVTIKRQERVGDALQPVEDALLSIRREPRAVRLEWPDGPHKGREVIYAADGDALMHVNMGPTSIVPPLALAPDSPLALRNSRHPITEAGFDTIVANVENDLKETQSGDPSHGSMTDGGLENPGQLEHPCRKIVSVRGNGETWVVYFDPETKLPVMVQANAPNGDLLERDVFGTPKTDLPDLASADAFDPGRRWGSSKGGLLQRLARSNAAQTADEPATR